MYIPVCIYRGFVIYLDLLDCQFVTADLQIVVLLMYTCVYIICICACVCTVVVVAAAAANVFSVVWTVFTYWISLALVRLSVTCSLSIICLFI